MVTAVLVKACLKPAFAPTRGQGLCKDQLYTERAYTGNSGPPALERVASEGRCEADSEHTRQSGSWLSGEVH